MPTSARWEAANSPKIFVKMVHSVGPMWASAPTNRWAAAGRIFQGSHGRSRAKCTLERSYNSISRLPQWGQMASSMSCRSPQAEQVFWRIKRSFPSKTPSALASRGRTIAVPPLVCRFLAEAALRSADTPLRDNGRTRHTPTARKRVSEGSSGMYSPDAVCFLAPTESSL